MTLANYIIILEVFLMVGGCANSKHIEQLVQNINENPDIHHGDLTPSVVALIEIGPSTIPSMLELMVNGDEPTRWRAQAVLHGIVVRRYGFVLGRGWTNPNGPEEAQGLWLELGNLDYRSGQDSRERAVLRWHQWYRNKYGPIAREQQAGQL